MIRSILVPVDGSPASQSALSVAASIAGLTHAKLFGVFVEDERRFLHTDLAATLAASTGVQPIVATPISPKEMLEVTEQVTEEGRQAEMLFEQSCKRAVVKGHFLIERGLPGDVIIRQAQSVDFVVIGNTGSHSGIEYAKGGLTTNALLHHTTRPTLVVPEEPQGEERIAVAYDGSAASERVLRFAAEFAELTRMKDFHLLTVQTTKERAEEAQQSALQYLSHYALTVKSVYRTGRVSDEIIHYIEEQDPSILALGAFGAGKLREMIFGSTTTVVLEKTKVAVLLMA